MAYGELGPTHHSIEDLAWLRAIPGLTVIVPADPPRPRRPSAGPRRPTGPSSSGSAGWASPTSYRDGYQFTPGRAVELRDGTTSPSSPPATMVARALDAAEQLEAEGIARPGAACRPSSRSTGTPCSRPPRDRRHRHRGGGPHRRGLGGAVAEYLARDARPDAVRWRPRHLRPDRVGRVAARPLRHHRRRHRRQRQGRSRRQSREPGARPRASPSPGSVSLREGGTPARHPRARRRAARRPLRGASPGDLPCHPPAPRPAAAGRRARCRADPRGHGSVTSRTAR